MENLFIGLFLEAHAKLPAQIILDVDTTDDPLHGRQEGQLFHGYYDCFWCNETCARLRLPAPDSL